MLETQRLFQQLDLRLGAKPTVCRNNLYLSGLSTVAAGGLPSTEKKSYGSDSYLNTKSKFTVQIDPIGVSGETLVERFWETKCGLKQDFPTTAIAVAGGRNMSDIFDMYLVSRLSCNYLG